LQVHKLEGWTELDLRTHDDHGDQALGHTKAAERIGLGVVPSVVSFERQPRPGKRHVFAVPLATRNLVGDFCESSPNSPGNSFLDHGVSQSSSTKPGVA
jgi:hypothetical protein